MWRKDLLSWNYNMSLGFIPVIISILLCEWFAQNFVIWIGVAISLAYSFYYIKNKKRTLPNIILYLTTAILILVGGATLLVHDSIPANLFPMTLELAILIPCLSLLLHKRRFINSYLKRSVVVDKKRLAQGIESSFVSIHIILLLGLLHLVLIGIVFIFVSSVSPSLSNVLYRIIPFSIFTLAIILNQLGIVYFNKISKDTAYFPIVTIKGGVIGKTLATDVLEGKTPETLYPVIRIAIMHNGMLFLSERSQNFLLDKGKTDIPCESYLKFGESLDAGCKRIIEKYFPNVSDLIPTFSIRYHFQNEVTNRLIYLYLLEIKDESLLSNQRFVGGKLWQLQQIDQNIGQNFFSECFENEYDYLKDIIDIREIYKES